MAGCYLVSSLAKNLEYNVDHKMTFDLVGHSYIHVWQLAS